MESRLVAFLLNANDRIERYQELMSHRQEPASCAWLGHTMETRVGIRSLSWFEKASCGRGTLQEGCNNRRHGRTWDMANLQRAAEGMLRWMRCYNANQQNVFVVIFWTLLEAVITLVFWLLGFVKCSHCFSASISQWCSPTDDVHKYSFILPPLWIY